MSRYVRATLTLANLDSVAEALTALGLPFSRHADGVMLQGSLECAGEPVDLRVPAGTLDAIEDFGFCVRASELQLVCGEIDRDLLLQSLVPQLVAHAVRQRVADVPGVKVTVGGE